MTIPAFPDLHEQTYGELDQWIARLRQVDGLLERSVTTLTRTAEWWSESGRRSVPLFISDTETAPDQHYLLVHAIYSSTVQRLADVRRRFEWLSKERAAALARLSEEMPRVLQAPPEADRRSLSFLKYAASDLFGALNPLTSAEVFWAFIRGGERYAHSGVGFLAFFGMLWSLGRRYPDAIEAGASLEPSGPSTNVTAKCLIAIRALGDALGQRGALFRRAAKLISKIETFAGNRRPHATWQFASELDVLAGTLFELSAYTLNRQKFVDAGEALLTLSRPLRSDSDTAGPWRAARDRIGELLRDLDHAQQEVFRDAADVVEGLFPQIIERLVPGSEHEELRRYCHKLATGKPDDYWVDHARAAEEARRLCARSLARLQNPFTAFDSLRSSGVPSAGLLTTHFNALADSNFDVATDIEKAIAPSVQWCQRAIDAESALASAGYVTDFDAAGLISAVCVAQKWNNISRMQAEDAIRHVLTAALQDGSWRRGQPIFLQDRVLGIWPHTPDIVWMLAVAVNAQPEITVADEKIFAFVSWLERTEMRFAWRDGGRLVHGWSSELDRQPRIIDFWNTAVSINALLEIRELIEYRLWRLCCRRFTIIRGRELSEVAPVDLGARHENRLHRRLRRMARLTELPDKYRDQLYALVLHGPPGSSKTAVVEGLGSEMWKDAAYHQPRIIRITPADFTQQGEARLDHEARRIFDLIKHVRGVTILFDEIDDFLRQRVLGEEIHFIKLVIPAMLNRLQDLRDAAPRQEICYILATNFIDKIEPALLRPGRIDAIIPVSYPDGWSREAILDANAGEDLSRSLTDFILDETIGWPWATFNKMARELGTKRERLTESAVKEHLDGFIDQVQNPKHYYFDAARWKKQSPPLVNEFVHLAFCTSKDVEKCRGTVAELAEWLDDNGIRSADHRLFDTFDRQVEVNGRHA